MTEAGANIIAPVDDKQDKNGLDMTRLSSSVESPNGGSHMQESEDHKITRVVTPSKDRLNTFSMNVRSDPKSSFLKEIAALQHLRMMIGEQEGLDDDLERIECLADGETQFFEALDQLLASDFEDEGRIAALDHMRGELEARKARMEARRAARRVVLEQALAVLERRTLQRPLGTLSLVQRPPALEVIEEADVPPEFISFKPVLDRKALKAALAEGRSVPGARLIDGVASLTIRRR